MHALQWLVHSSTSFRNVVDLCCSHTGPVQIDPAESSGQNLLNAAANSIEHQQGVRLPALCDERERQSDSCGVMAIPRRWRILVTKRRYLGMTSQMPSSSSLCASPSDDSSSSSSSSSSVGGQRSQEVVHFAEGLLVCTAD
eukprot:CAMPEP_0179124488 /NCGR_PEP_ID=MMETSP0796-20121207/58833_1 /TAXON_ID=73915 /ORGANISM="Pyrodinium bahamense, Strain pbaha01" /LENGTH=140 /DNA_ID=CAMNT_0020823155 /DNA_START=234 /DNA_END=652 /DNA_ORIENTATION=+